MRAHSIAELKLMKIGNVPLPPHVIFAFKRIVEANEVLTLWKIMVKITQNIVIFAAEANFVGVCDSCIIV